MRRSVLRAGAAVLLSGTIAGGLPSVSAQTTAPAFDHVVVILMENHSYGEIIGNPSAPYINSLAKSGGLATSYYAVAHPSLPNYLALAGGSTFGIASDCTTCWISAPNIADRLEAAGKTWKAYEESMPSACFVGDSYPYVQKHDPFIYFDDIRNNAARCRSHVVPYSQLSNDLGSASTTPNYSFITPDTCNDMHDCSISTGDSWLQQQVPQILQSPAFTTQHSLLALLWDEDDFTTTNQVPLILVGSGIAGGTQSATVYNHYSLLHTVDDALGVAPINLDGATPSITDMFSVAGWSPVGGILESDPAALSLAAGHLDVFVQGQDGALWHRAWDGASWQGWESLGGVLLSDPSAITSSATQADVFVRGQDNALWYRSWGSTTGWQSWQSLGGVLSSGTGAAASSGGNRVDVFVRGQDMALWHRWSDGTGWRPWESLGGVMRSDPGAAAATANQPTVFVRGQDNALWYRSWDGTGWSSWSSLGGVLFSSPEASSCGAGKLDVFVRGQDSSLWRRSFDGTSWGAWTQVGGQWTSGPGAVCQPATTTIDLFERGPDSSLWQRETT